MTTKPLLGDAPAIQEAIYGVALSLDSLLVNGIPCGVLQGALFPGFLEKAAGCLLRDLAVLEQHVPQTRGDREPEVRQTLAALRAKCQQLIDLAAGLCSFRTLPLAQVRAVVSRVPLLRGECVQLLQELEVLLRAPKPFYQSRPGHSAATVEDLLATMPHLLEDEWAASRSVTGQVGCG